MSIHNTQIWFSYRCTLYQEKTYHIFHFLHLYDFYEVYEENLLSKLVVWTLDKGAEARLVAGTIDLNRHGSIGSRYHVAIGPRCLCSSSPWRVQCHLHRRILPCSIAWSVPLPLESPESSENGRGCPILFTPYVQTTYLEISY